MKTMVCVNNLGYEAFNYDLFNDVNKTVTSSLEEVSIVPADITNKVIQINTAISNLAEMSSFSNGLMLAGTIENAKRILSCANTCKKALFLYDIDWFHSIMSYDDIWDTLNDSCLNIFCRSESHADAVYASTGRRPIVIGEFSLEKIWNSLE